MGNTETLLIVFVGITGVAVLLQACVLFALFMTVRKAVQSANEQADEYRGKLTPLLDTAGQMLTTANDLVASAQKLIKNVQPHVEAAVTELSGMASDIRAEAARLEASVDEVAARARYQAERVDGMATSFLNSVDRFGHFLNEAVHGPIRQVNGVIAAAKAVVDALRTPAPPRPRTRPTPQGMNVADDKDLFV
jgi:methyl-accepting chemotaxis protein